jgi:hypothetical protein
MDQLLLILAVLASPSGVGKAPAVSKPRRPADKPDSPDLLRSQSADAEGQGRAASGEA